MIPLPNIALRAAMKLGAVFAVVLTLAFLVHDRNHWKAEAALRQQQLAESKAAFDQTVAGYRAAAVQARADDTANAARVKSEQTAINERTGDEFQARIAAARADARRLRDNEAAATGSGHGRATPVPGLPAPARGIAQAPGENELSSDERELATEQAIQLDELIKWVDQQHAVDPNENTPH
jgi:DNA-binding protein H-NS